MSEKIEMKKSMSAGGYLAVGTLIRKIMLKMAKIVAIGPKVKTMVYW